ncbi:MAG: dephospho-CoA kinase [Ferruginibacter sp.]
MLRIGLTSGIGAGKTTAAKIFELLAVPVYYADEAAKRLINEDEALKAAITEHFGAAVYKEGKLNRKLLSSLVFNNSEKTALLNSIVHPATIADAEKWMLRQTTPYAIKEAALIFESGSEKKLDAVIGVSAPYELRLQRAMQRDQISAEEVKARMNRQMNEEEKLKRCRYVLVNDEQQLLIPQVIEVHQQLLQLSAPS